jgi:hypothetical protein
MSPFIWGTLGLIVLWLAGAVAYWSFDITVLFRGADGRLSASKLQFVMWTAVVMYTYVSAFAAAASQGRWSATIKIPPEVVAAMGLSVATLVGAKSITVSQLVRGKIGRKDRVSSEGGGAGRQNGTGVSDLICEDDGSPDFTKMQMLGWTIIAAGLYCAQAIDLIRDLPGGDVVRLPGIDAGLVALAGIGHAAYLGKKVVSEEEPRLSGIAPPSGHAATPLTLFGRGFGQKDGAALVVDGIPTAVLVTAWSDERIDLVLPATRPDGAPWPHDRAVSLGIVTGGRPTVNTLPFTFAS